MTRNLRFFYFGNQCPHNGYLLARIKTLAWKEGVHLELFDISMDRASCEEYQIFSPQMLIVNGRHRLHGPFTKEAVLELLDDETTSPQTLNQTGEETVRGELVPITAKSVLATCEPCLNTIDRGLCRGKAEWISGLQKSYGMNDIGYMHIIDGACVGGVEYLPATAVPYPIPQRGRDDAFLTCVYRSHERFDYKSHPLEQLVSDLRGKGFKSVMVAAAMNGIFPNGPMSWFEKKGFSDEGVLVREKLHDAEIHLLRLDLSG